MHTYINKLVRFPFLEATVTVTAWDDKSSVSEKVPEVSTFFALFPPKKSDDGGLSEDFCPRRRDHAEVIVSAAFPLNFRQLGTLQNR